jgi:hypothetical protein
LSSCSMIGRAKPTMALCSADMKFAKTDFEFDYSLYSDENAASSALSEKHQEMLSLLGVPFGRGGFKVVDKHTDSRGLLVATDSGAYR